MVKRTEPAFVGLPRRWVVERTLGWMTRHRRLMRDDEGRIDVYEAMAGLSIQRITIISRKTDSETHLRQLVTAAAIDLGRIADWIAEQKPAQTRKSSVVRLVTAPT